jgi:hypothetical protein
MRGGSAAEGIYSEGVGSAGRPSDDEFSDGVARGEVSVEWSSSSRSASGKHCRTMDGVSGRWHKWIQLFLVPVDVAKPRDHAH